LFADISGFTSLTEQLTRNLGVRRGIEELTQRINTVYDSLTGSVEQYSGSVVSFAGDAITCWFDDAQERSAARATAAAQIMQTALGGFEGLALKVAVTGGPARRFVVGNPAIQLIDVLAGATVARLATAEQLANPGEILLDVPTVKALGETLWVKQWRAAEEESFAVYDSLNMPVPTMPLATHLSELAAETLEPWLLPTVYQRERSGFGTFLTELRPAVALFVRFTGIDYDGDEQAAEKLDAVIRRTQLVMSEHDGTLLQVTIGDKGSYLYASFGAPVAHEDDAMRAVHAALSLRQLPDLFPFLRPVQIGVSCGTMRTGTYGSRTRHTYGALGDDVNLAARLMTSASPGEILASGRVMQALAARFMFEPRPPLTVRGKAEPQRVFAVSEVRHQRAIKLEEPSYALPMLGRQPELAVIGEKLRLASEGLGQVVGISAEAGMGKSRLVAEAIREAHQLGFTGYGGACEASGTSSAYLVWKPIWQAFFYVDTRAHPRQQAQRLMAEIEARAPHRLQALPLLGPLLELSIDDNDFTHALEPKDRRNALEALLEDCIKAAANEGPILIVLEDVHWIDPLSQDLLEALVRATANTAVCFVMAYRPPEATQLQTLRMQSVPSFTRVPLDGLATADVEQLISAKLAQWFPARACGLPQALASQISARADGNPFYVEELLNYLRDCAINPYDAEALSALELPNSLHALILSRIDQLTEPQKATLKVASIIGRLFLFAWLYGYYPSLGTREAVKADLSALARLDLTPLDTPEPELAYLFKHVVTQEVAYESLAYATRAQLHEQLAQFIEGLGADTHLDLLAFHYGRSENIAKQRDYFRKAGDAAQTAFANESALDYYARLAPLLTEPGEQADLHLRQGTVLELVGQYTEAETHYQDALAQAVEDATRTARVQLALGKLCHLQGHYQAALEWLAQARHGWEMLQDHAGLTQTVIEMGFTYYRQEEYATARERLHDGLTLSRELGDKRSESIALHTLGLAAFAQGDYATAKALQEESLVLARQIGDQSRTSWSLDTLGHVSSAQGDFATAAALHEESLALSRQMGDKVGVAWALRNVGLVAADQGDYAKARVWLEQSLALSREMDNKLHIAVALTYLGEIFANQGDYLAAQTQFEETLELGRLMGEKWAIAEALTNLGYIALHQADYATARGLLKESLTLSQTISQKAHIISNLNALAGVAVAHRDEALKASQLAGATEGLREALGILLEPMQRGVYEHTIAVGKATLGEEGFIAAFEAGRRLSLDEAVQFAFEED
jgi:predicted ATPase/class 3 adenylate cyclase